MSELQLLHILLILVTFLAVFSLVHRESRPLHKFLSMSCRAQGPPANDPLHSFRFLFCRVAPRQLLGTKVCWSPFVNGHFFPRIAEV